jgi:hypothetical protein
MVRGGWDGLAVLWTWSVLSQEAEMRRAGGTESQLFGVVGWDTEGLACLQCSALYTTQRTASECLLMTVCCPVERSILLSQKESANRSQLCMPYIRGDNGPLHLMIQPRRERLVRTGAKADI